MMWHLMRPKKNSQYDRIQTFIDATHPDAKRAGFSAAARHKTQVSIWFCHTEEMTQLLRSAGYRERRRARVVVMAPSQTMDPEGWKGDTITHTDL